MVKTEKIATEIKKPLGVEIIKKGTNIPDKK